MPPEPTFAISIEGRLESARHGILWVGFTSSRPSRSGARLFARVGYPAELQTAMDDPVVDGHSVEKMIR